MTLSPRFPRLRLSHHKNMISRKSKPQIPTMSINITSSRARFGLIIPSANTPAENGFSRMRIPGESRYSGRIVSNLAMEDSFVPRGIQML
jgi:hypothetical protein